MTNGLSPSDSNKANLYRNLLYTTQPGGGGMTPSPATGAASADNGLTVLGPTSAADVYQQMTGQSLTGQTPSYTSFSPSALTAQTPPAQFAEDPDDPKVQQQQVLRQRAELQAKANQLSANTADVSAQYTSEVVTALAQMGIPQNYMVAAARQGITPQDLLTQLQTEAQSAPASTSPMSPAMALAAQVDHENTPPANAELDQAGKNVTDAQQKAEDDKKKSESPGWFKALTIGASTAASFIPVVGSGAAALIGAGGSIMEQQGFGSEKGWDPSRKVNYWQAGAIGAVSMIPGGGIMGKTGAAVAEKVIGKKIAEVATASTFEKLAFNGVQHATTGAIAGATGGAGIEIGRQFGTGDFNLLKVGESAIIGGATGGLTAGVLGTAKTGIGLKLGRENVIASEANQAYGTIAARKNQWGGNWVALPAERALDRSGRALGAAGRKVGEAGQQIGQLPQKISNLRAKATTEAAASNPMAMATSTPPTSAPASGSLTIHPNAVEYNASIGSQGIDFVTGKPMTGPTTPQLLNIDGPEFGLNPSGTASTKTNSTATAAEGSASTSTSSDSAEVSSKIGTTTPPEAGSKTTQKNQGFFARLFSGWGGKREQVLSEKEIAKLST